ncbi:MAG: D-aminoacylase, partial [Clostridiales bacterium]|nr:D-aminoacylase [Clostridiales bacterium]
MIYHNMSPGDVDRAICWPPTSVISDALYAGGRPHPRAYGSFPLVLRDYVRERGLLSLEQAIHKMTALPAAQLRIPD